jgi:hypothetical protein
MGKYLNPEAHPGECFDAAKLRFCEENGRLIAKEEFETMQIIEGEDVPVCMVDNGAFLAVLICDTQSEVNFVKEHPDPRPKQYWLLNNTAIQPYL